MGAQAKFTRRRESRFLALIENGAAIAEASRAVQVSRMTVYRHARADPFFAVELRAARAGEGRAASVEPPDWRAVAAQLERENPERLALPGGGLD